jgi:hypothetical protein
VVLVPVSIKSKKQTNYPLKYHRDWNHEGEKARSKNRRNTPVLFHLSPSEKMKNAADI